MGLEIELQSSADFRIQVCTNLPGHQKERCESGRSHSVVVAYFPVMCSSSSIWFCHIAIHNFSICNPVITCFQSTLHCALHVRQGSTQYGTAISSWSPFHTFKSVRWKTITNKKPKWVLNIFAAKNMDKPWQDNNMTALSTCDIAGWKVGFLWH